MSARWRPSVLERRRTLRLRRTIQKTRFESDAESVSSGEPAIATQPRSDELTVSKLSRAQLEQNADWSGNPLTSPSGPFASARLVKLIRGALA